MYLIYNSTRTFHMRLYVLCAYHGREGGEREGGETPTSLITVHEDGKTRLQEAD